MGCIAAGCTEECGPGSVAGHQLAGNALHPGILVQTTSGGRKVHLVAPGLPGGGAFLWQNGVITDLGTVPGDVVSEAGSINDKGQVIGQSCDIDDNCSAFLWQNGVMMDLNTLIPADSPLALFEASGINSRGEIVGVASTSTGDIRAFLAIPSNGEATSATAAARGETSQRPKFVLSENARKLLRHRLAQRYHIPGLANLPQK